VLKRGGSPKQCYPNVKGYREPKITGGKYPATVCGRVPGTRILAKKFKKEVDEYKP